VPTVYKAFTNKRNLLTAAVATAMTGGPDEPVDRQAWFHEQLDAPTAEQQRQLIARNARRLNDRAASLLELVRATAARDRQIAALWHNINNERLARSRTSARRLAAKTTLRTGVPDAAHTVGTDRTRALRPPRQRIRPQPGDLPALAGRRAHRRPARTLRPRQRRRARAAPGLGVGTLTPAASLRVSRRDRGR
jgi:hypothetical protein